MTFVDCLHIDGSKFWFWQLLALRIIIICRKFSSRKKHKLTPQKGTHTWYCSFINITYNSELGSTRTLLQMTVVLKYREPITAIMKNRLFRGNISQSVLRLFPVLGAPIEVLEETFWLFCVALQHTRLSC